MRMHLTTVLLGNLETAIFMWYVVVGGEAIRRSYALRVAAVPTGHGTTSSTSVFESSGLFSS